MPRISRSYHNTPRVVRKQTSRPTQVEARRSIARPSPVQRPTSGRPTGGLIRPRVNSGTKTRQPITRLRKQPQKLSDKGPRSSRSSWPSSTYQLKSSSSSRTYVDGHKKILPKNSPLKPLVRSVPEKKKDGPKFAGNSNIQLTKFKSIKSKPSSKITTLGKGSKNSRRRVVKVTKGKPHGRKVVTYKKLRGKFPTKVAKKRLY
jgi:hypothetical protein